MNDVLPPSRVTGPSGQVHAASAMVGVGALFGALVLTLVTLLTTGDLGALRVLGPLLTVVALAVAAEELGGVRLLSGHLLRRTPGSRLVTAVLGGLLAVAGLAQLGSLPGLMLLAYGAGLAWLVATAPDLGDWVPQRRTSRHAAPRPALPSLVRDRLS